MNDRMPAEATGTIKQNLETAATIDLAGVMLDALDLIECVGARGGGRTLGVSTGFSDLDSITSGLRPGTLTVVAGQPGIGKSVLLRGMCRSAAIGRNLPVVLFTLGEATNSVVLRVLAAEAKVPYVLMCTGGLSDDDWGRLAKRMNEIADSPLYLNESAELSATALWDESALLVAERGVKLVAIDGLQLITPDRRHESREREVAEIVRQLRLLAIRMQVPVVVTASLDLASGQSLDNLPRLSGLLASNAIAQLADVVVLVHRERHYDYETPRGDEMDLIVVKNKFGPIATCTVEFLGHYQAARGPIRKEK